LYPDPGRSGVAKRRDRFGRRVWPAEPRFDRLAVVAQNPPARGVTVSALQATFVLAGLQAAGADARAVMTKAGLAPEDLSDPQKRLPRELIMGLWYAANEVSGDPAFALHVAEKLRPGMFDVLDYLARSSLTLREAMTRAQRYVRLFDDVAELLIEEEGDEVTLVVQLGHGHEMPLGVAECVVTAGLIFARQTTGVAMRPVAVSFTRKAPPDLREHERVLGVTPRFSAARNELRLTSADLALRLVTADPTLSAILDRHAGELLDRLPPIDKLVDRVRGILAEELRGGDPSAERVAARLSMSTRTLRRKLEEQGTGLSPLLDELRRDLALRYLDEARLGLTEIAFELGFADERAFRRAFKRWTGRTPRGRE
jgi:AraC-like DNA-binding protein